MYVSVDRSIEKLERQLKRHKDKIKRRKSQQSVADIAGDPDAAEDEAAEAEAEDVEETELDQ
jgi:hypothetical protein